jgi:hypothetical protein
MPRRRLTLKNATLAEIEKRYADRIPNAATLAAIAEDTRKYPRYESAAEMLKALKSPARGARK